MFQANIDGKEKSEKETKLLYRWSSPLFFGTSPDSSKLAFTNEAEWETRRTDTFTISYHRNQDAKKQTNNVKLIPLRPAVNSNAIINDVL